MQTVDRTLTVDCSIVREKKAWSAYSLNLSISAELLVFLYILI